MISEKYNEIGTFCICNSLLLFHFLDCLVINYPLTDQMFENSKKQYCGVARWGFYSKKTRKYSILTLPSCKVSLYKENRIFSGSRFQSIDIQNKLTNASKRFSVLISPTRFLFNYLRLRKKFFCYQIFDAQLLIFRKTYSPYRNEMCVQRWLFYSRNKKMKTCAAI